MTTAIVPEGTRVFMSEDSPPDDYQCQPWCADVVLLDEEQDTGQKTSAVIFLISTPDRAAAIAKLRLIAQAIISCEIEEEPAEQDDEGDAP